MAREAKTLDDMSAAVANEMSRRLMDPELKVQTNVDVERGDVALVVTVSPRRETVGALSAAVVAQEFLWRFDVSNDKGSPFRVTGAVVRKHEPVGSQATL